MGLIFKRKKKRKRKNYTHERSNCVVGCDEPPIVCAKLVMGPLFGRGFPRTPLPIGTPPPPKGQVAPPPLLAISNLNISTSWTSSNEGI